MMGYESILEALRARVEAQAKCTVLVGALPTTEGLSMLLTGGAVKPDMCGNQMLVLRIALNAKARAQQDALGTLDAAHSGIGVGMNSDAWQITGASVKAAPALVGQDVQGWFIYASALEVRAFVPGGSGL